VRELMAPTQTGRVGPGMARRASPEVGFADERHCASRRGSRVVLFSGRRLCSSHEVLFR